jgi:hypothetical protein
MHSKRLGTQESPDIRSLPEFLVGRKHTTNRLESMDGQGLGVEVSKVELARFPEDMEHLGADFVSDPVVAHIDRFCAFGPDRIGGDADCTLVVTFDGRWLMLGIPERVQNDS